ncbi:MAG: TetR/AcrR family transcriptional regulator [Mycobacterium sp.]
MARQVRSEVTRRKILDAAIGVFAEVGYAAAGWNSIIERTGMTKGALYHHFDSKESLASAIIEEGSEAVLTAVGAVCGSSSPGLENMIHGTFTLAHVLGSDATVRAAEQLTAALSGFNKAAGQFCEGLVALIAAQARRASAEGDLRADLDPVALSETLIGAVVGTRLMSNAMGHAVRRHGSGVADLASPRQIWEFLLAGVATDESLPYFREFLARESLRHAGVDADE